MAGGAGGMQTRGDAGHFFFMRPVGPRVEYVLATLDGTPVAVVRMPHGCSGSVGAVAGGRAAHAIHLWADPGDPGTRVWVVVDTIERFNAVTEPFARLTIADLFAESNYPYDCELDDENVVLG